MTWQSIAVAPKDGTEILAVTSDNSKRYRVVFWCEWGTNKDYYGWHTVEDAYSRPHSWWTHWMPLPEPPYDGKWREVHT